MCVDHVRDNETNIIIDSITATHSSCVIIQYKEIETVLIAHLSFPIPTTTVYWHGILPLLIMHIFYQYIFKDNENMSYF